MSNVRALSFIWSLSSGHGPPQWLWPALVSPRPNAVRSLPMKPMQGTWHAPEQLPAPASSARSMSLARTRVSPYIKHHAKNLAACEPSQWGAACKRTSGTLVYARDVEAYAQEGLPLNANSSSRLVVHRHQPAQGSLLRSRQGRIRVLLQQRSNPSIEGTASGLRPPAAPHVKR
jgi:hypothetical protein